MHYELEITCKQEEFTVNVNYNIISYFNKFNIAGDDWFDVNLTENDISNLKKLVVTDEEKEFIKKLKKNEPIDIIEHFYF